MQNNSISFRNKILAGFITSIVLIFAITLISYQKLHDLEKEHQLADHTREVTKAATDLLQRVTDAETSARGYFGTSQEVFITAFQRALEDIDPNFQRLFRSVQDDAAQLHIVEQLGARVVAKQTVMKSYVSQRQASGTTGSIPIYRVLEGKTEMDLIRKLVADVIINAQNQLRQQQQRSEMAATNASIVLFGGALLFMVMICTLFFYIKRTFDQKTAAEQSVHQNNAYLEKTLSENKHQNWMLQGLKHLAEQMQGQSNMEDLGAVILKELIEYTEGVAGTMYLYQTSQELLNFCAAHAVSPKDEIRKQFRLTETWIGQVGNLQQAKLISGRFNSNLTLSTSIFQKELAHCFIVPFFYEQQLCGILELGYREAPTDISKGFILSTLSRIGITVHAMLAKREIEELYEAVHQQAEELQVQQEELKASNEELLLRTRKTN
ncbi:CHASE3 domain-containing protein [Mucilaginibacter sp. PAMB04274]|uniref:CHASE3 domain-containing protein n=1 Tax=Mucilaginibacter sp. PAMB04274 TaxID=3138568 RepID=UPI0031F6F1BE